MDTLTVRIWNEAFTEEQIVIIDVATMDLPQVHCDAVSYIDQGTLGNDVMGECTNQYNIITMNSEEAWDVEDVQHEIGHAVLNRYGAHPRSKFAQYYNNLADSMGTTGEKLEAQAKRLDTPMYRHPRFPTAYSMVDPEELFAESYALFVSAPRTLQKRCPDLYNYMRDKIFDGIEYIRRNHEEANRNENQGKQWSMA